MSKTKKSERTFLEEAKTDPSVELDQVTKNFKLSELEKDCKIPQELKADAIALLKDLQILRTYLNRSITIISGYRSEEFNASLREKGGGDSSGVAKVSQHTFARAADIVVEGLKPEAVADIIFLLEAKGAFSTKPSVGIYDSFVHFDRRTAYGLSRARWRS